VPKVNGIFYSFLTPGFAITGGISIMKIKRYFPKFYKKHRCVLWTVVCGITLSILTRAILDCLIEFNETFLKWVVTHENTLDPIIFILSDLVPIIFQLTTLMFGYIRRKTFKQIKKNRRSK